MTTLELPPPIVERLPRQLVREHERLGSRLADAQKAVRELSLEHEAALETDERADSGTHESVGRSS
jgi:hypothetical protein